MNEFIVPKPINEIPVVPIDDIQTGNILAYTGTGDLKKVSTNELLGFIKSGITGVATQSNAPTPYDAVTYPDGLFETYVVRTPLTMPNSWGSAVTQAELDANNVFFDVTNGVVSKELSAKSGLKLSQVIESERSEFATSEKAVADFVEDKLFVEGKNLFDFTKIFDGHYIDPATGELADSPPFFASDFIAVQGSENYIVSPNFTFICFYDVNKIFISGTGLANQTAISTPLNARYLRFSQNSYPVTAEFFQLEKGTVATTYEPYNDKVLKFLENKGSVKINKITAVKNPENYNSVRNLVAGITDASEYNQYVIFVPAGTWNELDWSGKKWVKIFGDISGETIINLDPLGSMASNVVPAGFPFPSEIGKTLSTTVQYARHIIFVQDDIHCENLTFKAKDSKYAIHIDDTKYKKAYFKNCHIIDDNCNYPVGMGINGGQEVMFESCVLKSLNINKFGFFYHNWNNQTEGNTVTFNRCKFDNCRYGFIDELGSEQTDFINITNCFSTLGAVGQWLNFLVDITGDGKTYWVNPATSLKEPNPVNVPYCIVVNTSGTKINQLTANDSANFNPDWSGIPQRDIAKIEEMSIIEK